MNPANLSQPPDGLNLDDYSLRASGEVAEDRRPSEIKLPVGRAAFACIVCFAFIYWSTKFMVARLGVWWAELLIYSLLPMAVSFVILYRSGWHVEMARAARASWLVVLSGLILCGEFVFFGILVAAVCIFVGLGRGHG